MFVRNPDSEVFARLRKTFVLEVRYHLVEWWKSVEYVPSVVAARVGQLFLHFNENNGW